MATDSTMWSRHMLKKCSKFVAHLDTRQHTFSVGVSISQQFPHTHQGTPSPPVGYSGPKSVSRMDLARLIPPRPHSTLQQSFFTSSTDSLSTYVSSSATCCCRGACCRAGAMSSLFFHGLCRVPHLQASLQRLFADRQGHIPFPLLFEQVVLHLQLLCVEADNVVSSEHIRLYLACSQQCSHAGCIHMYRY